MYKLLSALLLCSIGALCGCASPPPPPPGGYSVCATDPGGYACQVERYQNVD